MRRSFTHGSLPVWARTDSARMASNRRQRTIVAGQDAGASKRQTRSALAGHTGPSVASGLRRRKPSRKRTRVTAVRLSAKLQVSNAPAAAPISSRPDRHGRGTVPGAVGRRAGLAHGDRQVDNLAHQDEIPGRLRPSPDQLPNRRNRTVPVHAELLRGRLRSLDDAAGPDEAVGQCRGRARRSRRPDRAAPSAVKPGPAGISG
jgi:hypothetical protein